MMTWMILGVIVAAALAWKVLHAAQKDDKARKSVRKR